MQGLGVDRHLLGLKMAAKELGIEVPELFLDKGYIRTSHMRISSSQVIFDIIILCDRLVSCV